MKVIINNLMFVTMKKNVNERIRHVRSVLVMNQTEFAAAIETSVSLISKIESGDLEPSPKLLKKMCEKFGIDSEWLSDGKGELSINLSKTPDNPWKEEAYTNLKSERDYFKEKYTKVIDAILSGNLGKLLALKEAVKMRKAA